MTTIYHLHNAKNVRETAFFNHFRSFFPNAAVVNEKAGIDSNALNLYVDKLKSTTALEDTTLLSSASKQKCYEALQHCPQKMKVTLLTSRLSFDIVIKYSGRFYYWEFHEEQHKNLTVSRMKKVFSPSGASTEVPRFLQRLIRDVWRVEHFQPYTIVWHDWFAQNQNEYKPSLDEGLHEYSLPGKFSFKNFLGLT